MLSIGTIAAGDYYLNQSKTEGYYQSELEPPGQWLGQGAASLRLKGQVQPEAFRLLLEGYAPDGTDRHVQNAGKSNRKKGWDLTFSADKTVSVFGSQTDEKTRQVIGAAHADAVKAAVSYLEDVAGWTRRGKGGGVWEKTQLLVAAFEHGSSRAGDPALHTHALFINIGVRADGTLGSLVSKPLYQHKMTAGALYRAELAALLQERLGLEMTRSDALFHLTGVPDALCQAFSQRRAQIKQVMKERGIISAAGAAAATLATRATKSRQTRDELRGRWQETGRKHGFTELQARALLGRARPQKTDCGPVFLEAVARIMEGESWFEERRLLRTMAELAPGTGLTAADLRAGLRAGLTHDPKIAPLGNGRYTTREMLHIESELLDAAQRLQSAVKTGITPGLVAKAMRAAESQASKAQGKTVTLNAEQRAALEHVTQRPGQLKLISGMAGTGKTFFLSAARQVWEAGGYKVLGAALAGKAAQGLEEGAGITSSTLTRLLMDLNKTWVETAGHHLWQIARAAQGKTTWGPQERITLDKNTVLVLDEAGMIGTKALAAVITAVEKAGAKLVLVGDAAQLQAIEAGGVFGALLKRLGAAELTSIVRQREEWARQAVTQFANGQAGAALQEYAKRGLFHVADTRPQAAARLIADWKKHGVARPEDSLIFTGTREERDLLNRLAQEERKKAGKLGMLPLRIGGKRFYLGDRVMFTQNSKMNGIQNGMLGSLVAFNPITNVARIRLDGAAGKRGKTVSIGLNKYNALDLGYAMTTHKGQGVTVERAFVMADSRLQSRELTYVQMSRARGETRLYADKATAGEDFAELIKAMESSRQKTLAVDAAALSSEPSPFPAAPTGEAPRLVPVAVQIEPASSPATLTVEVTVTAVLTTPSVGAAKVTPAPETTPPVSPASAPGPTSSPKPIVPTIRPR